PIAGPPSGSWREEIAGSSLVRSDLITGISACVPGLGAGGKAPPDRSGEWSYTPVTPGREPFVEKLGKISSPKGQIGAKTANPAPAGPARRRRWATRHRLARRDMSMRPSAAA